MTQALMPPQPSNIYAKVGTAAHLVIECFLLGNFDICEEDWKDVTCYLESQGMIPKERHSLYRYLNTIQEYRGKVVALEHEFLLPVIPGALPLKGHLDLIVQGTNGDLIIVDHKTNRKYEGVELWAKKTQMIAYAWAVRKLLPGMPIHFQIGYVNLNSQITWQTDPLLDTWFETSFSNAWQEFCVYRRTNEWPERIHSGCGYCARQSSCQTFIGSMKSLLTLTTNPQSSDDLSALTGQSLSDKVNWLRSTLKAGSKLLDTYESALIELASNSTEPYIVDSNNRVSLSYSRRRQANTDLAWMRLMDLLMEHPEIDEMWQEEMSSVLTFKVGGLDKLAKREARFKQILDVAVTEVQSENPTLNIGPLEPAQAHRGQLV